MNVNKEITVRKNKVFVKVISMVITHVNVIKISLENSQFNSNYIYDWIGTEEAKDFLVNFLFLDFYISFLFVTISERFSIFRQNRSTIQTAVDFFLRFERELVYFSQAKLLSDCVLTPRCIRYVSFTYGSKMKSILKRM